MSCARLQAFDPPSVDGRAELWYTVSMNEYDKSKFKIDDLYDIISRELEEQKREREKFGDPWEADSEIDEAFDPFDGLRPNEEYVLAEYAGSDESVVVPDGVTVIKASAFKGNVDIVKVVMPDSVRKLEAYAFAGCTGLRSVRLGSYIKSIDFDTFAKCASLKTVELPERLSDVNIRAFAESGIENIFIPASVSFISGDAFSGCDNISIEVSEQSPHYYSRDNCIYDKRNKWLVGGYNDGNMPDDGSFTTIAADAFAGNPRLVDVAVPLGVTDIHDGAFEHCRNLVRIKLPDELKSLGACAFSHCHALESITIPGSVKKLERFAFDECGIERAVLKRGVEEVDEYAFRKCVKLKEVYIPRTAEHIEYNAFDDCPVGMKIFFEADTIAPELRENLNDFEAIAGHKSKIFD